MRPLLHKPDYGLLITTLALVVFGLIMLSSASSVISFEQYGDANTLLRRQVISALIGIAAFMTVQKLDYHIWKKFSVILLFLSILFLIMVFIPGIGEEYLGARRWINLGVQFQPTELVKLAFLVYLASWLEKKRSGFSEPMYSFLPFMVILGLITALVMAQPDLGTMTVIALIAVIVYFVAGAPVKHFFWIFTIAAALFAFFIKIAPYRAARLTVFLNPALDPQGIGYHINQALLAIGTGGLFGVGLGHSRQKFNYLPEAAGDSIFAIIAEELGFLFVIVLLGAFTFFIYRGIFIARNAPDEFGRLLAAGVTAWLGLQAFINIGALSGILPLTGIPLPFISYGGTALAINLVAAAILLSVSRQTREQKKGSYRE